MIPTEELQDDPKSKRHSFFLLPVAIIAIAAIAYGLMKPAPERTEQRVAPDFELPLLEGGTLSSDELRGSPVVLNFWASWCTPCREEAPLFEELAREYEDVRFVGVNVQDNDPDARAFVKEFDISYPIVRDREQDLFEDLREVNGLPQTFFIDREWRFSDAAGVELGSNGGTVVLGAISEEDLRAQLDRLVDAGDEGR